MNIINIEFYSIVILIILISDYITKFIKKFNTASLIWLALSSGSLLISISNVVLSLTNIYFIKVLALTTNLVCTLACSIYTYIYIKYVYITNKMNVKKEFLHAFFTVFGCVIFTLIFTFSHRSGYTIHSFDRNFFSKLLPMAIVPNIVAIILYLKHCINSSKEINIKVLVTLLISVIALLIDQHNDSLYFVSATFTLTTLILYINKHEELLNTDALTGLSNKRSLEIFIKNLKHELTVAAFNIDINKFKLINDNYGHLKGDYVLKKVAEILRNSARDVDLVIRNGGDEFLILTIIKEEKDARIILDRINERIDKYNEKAEIKFTLSIGWDIYRSHEKTSLEEFEKFLKKIDEKMYKEKEKTHRRKTDN